MPIYKILISILLILPVATQASATVFPAGRFKIPKFCKGPNCPNIPDKRMPRIWDRATPPEAFFSIEKTFWVDAEITYKIKNFE